jgi:rubredoxin
MDAKRRTLVWVERQNFQRWACTECAWVFKASGPPAGNSLGEMKQNYEQRRDKEFTSHVCAQLPRVEKDPG